MAIIRNFILLFVVLVSTSIRAHPGFNPDSLEKTIENVLHVFNTPGMSVAVVYQGEVLYLAGHGLASIADNTKVDEHTYFRLASVSKAFTSAGLTLLVEREQLAWDEKVNDILPEFRLQDDYATKHITVRDLLTHKSGLAGGAGDSMIWPEPSGFSRTEVVQRLRYLTPVYSFASQYSYSNVMYITAGQVIEAVSGTPFEQYIDQNLFAALKMPCYSGAMPIDKLQNVAAAHGFSEEEGLYEIPRNKIGGHGLMSAAAGGMVCNGAGMSRWLLALLDGNDLPFSKNSRDYMWRSHTLLSVSKEDYEWDGTHFRAYGLGWRLSNIDNYKFISHTGTLSGYQAYVGLIPELQLGISILNNGSDYGARGAVMQSIVKSFISDSTTDWIAKYQDYQAKREQKSAKRNALPIADKPMLFSKSDLAGEYEDEWFGKMHLYMKGGELRIKSLRMKTLTGRVEEFQANSFKIVWDNQNAQRDALLFIDTDIKSQIVGFRLHPFVARERSNHEYRDMYFALKNPAH